MTSTPSAAAAIGTYSAVWKPSSIPCGEVRPAVAAVATAVTTASPRPAPNWKEVLSRPPASPCSSSAIPSVAAIVSGP